MATYLRNINKLTSNVTLATVRQKDWILAMTCCIGETSSGWEKCNMVIIFLQAMINSISVIRAVLCKIDKTCWRTIDENPDESDSKEGVGDWLLRKVADMAAWKQRDTAPCHNNRAWRYWAYGPHVRIPSFAMTFNSPYPPYDPTDTNGYVLTIISWSKLMSPLFLDSRTTRTFTASYITSWSGSSRRYETVVRRWPVIITGVVDQLHNACHAFSLEARQPGSDAHTLELRIAEGKGIIEQISKLKYQMGRNHPLE